VEVPLRNELRNDRLPGWRRERPAYADDKGEEQQILSRCVAEPDDRREDSRCGGDRDFGDNEKLASVDNVRKRTGRQGATCTIDTMNGSGLRPVISHPHAALYIQLPMFETTVAVQSTVTQSGGKGSMGRPTPPSQPREDSGWCSSGAPDITHSPETSRCLRTLKAPIACGFSCLTTTSTPVRALSPVLTLHWSVVGLVLGP
jgi:hypothetical protein